MTILKPRRIQRFGWKPDTPDQRDRAFKVGIPKAQLQKILGKTRDLSHSHMPFIYDQSSLGSCTANAIAAAVQYRRSVEKLPDFQPSRLAIYYGERFIEGTVQEDAGAEIRDGMKVVAREGTASEDLWPYDIRRFVERPTDAYYTEARTHYTTSYERVPQTEHGIKAALWDGYPVVFGFSVYESFESGVVESTGKVPLPKMSEYLLGGHAILATGFTATAIRFRNSWGAGWGKGGFGTMPLDYVLDQDLASDFWIVKVTA